MELSPSWEVSSCASQEIAKILLNPKVPILSQIYPVHTTPSHLSKIHFNIIHPPAFCSGFPTKILCAFLFAPIRVTFPAHLVLLGLIIQVILGEG
jgi:hypothetical protein